MLRVMKARLTRARRSSTIRKKARPRYRFVRLELEPLESRTTPVTGMTSFAPGAYVIDMGQATQTVANSLKPYGMVYDLVQNQHIPVDWAINPNKAIFGADFSAGGQSYSGGPFVIEAPFAAAAAATITKWRAQGVVVNQITSSFVAPIYNTITSFPRTILDQANGKIAQAYYTLAGIPQFSSTIQNPTQAAYIFGTPLSLNQCNDIYVLPHADPSKWPANYKTALLNFINNGGWLYQQCHSVSDLDNSVAHLLSSGLILYKNHKAGTPPYNYNPSTAADPEMQFTTRIDAATQNGSEQIYVPSATGAWLPTTHVGVYDPDQPNASGTTLSKNAGVLTYGPAFGDPTAGWVMYEGGHSLAGTAPANVGAMRAFFDFILHAGIAHTPQITDSSFPPTLTAGAAGTVSATIGLGSMRLVSYQWTSTNGGTFSNQSAVTDPTTGAVTITATFTAANVPTTITLAARDDCGHQILVEHQILAVPPPVNRPPVAVNDSYTTPQDRALIVSTAATSLLHNDSDPDGDPLIVSSFDRTSTNGGTVAVNPDGTFTYTPRPGFTGTDTFTYTISDGRWGFSTATATITVTPTPPPTPTAPPHANNDNYATNPTTPILGQNILGNDILNFATITGVSNLQHIVQWDGNPATVPPAGTAYFTINQTTGVVDFYPNGYTGAAPQFDYTITNALGSSHATVKFDIKTDAPLANEDYATVAGYTTGQTPTSVIIPITDNDIPHDPNFVGWSQPVISGLPAGATATVVQIGTNEFGQPIWGIKYTPAVNHVTGPNQAPDTFTYKVTELVKNPTTGVISNGKEASTSVFVTVVNVPTANNDTFTVPQNSDPTTLNVLQNDSAAGSPIRIQSVNVPNGATPNGGAVFISDDGLTLIYQPAHGFTGTDTFTYTIIDGNGNTSTATVTVNVPPVPNRPPVANPDEQFPIPNNSSVPVGDTVTDNDTDPDNDPLTVTQIVNSGGTTLPVPADPNTPVTIAGEFGTLVLNSRGNYTYQVDTTNPAVSGLPIGGTIDDVFTYTITDGNGHFSTTTLTIPITRFNQPPVAVDDAYTVDAGRPLVVPVAQGVLSNDSDPDPEDAGHLTVISINNNTTGIGQPVRLPSGAIVTLNPDGSFTYDPNGVFNNLTPGTTGTDSFTYAITDPHGSVSTATAVFTINPPVADLSIVKSVDNPTPNVGDIVTFTVVVTNNGPDFATNVAAQEVTPVSGLAFVSATPSQGTFDQANLLWTVGTLASGGAATIAIRARVLNSNLVTNTAAITHSDQFDPDPSNNSSSATVQGAEADLAVTKTVDNPTPNVGNAVNFTITVTNLAGSAAKNIQVTDLLPSGLQFVSASTADGTYSDTTGIWALAGSLAPGQSSTLTIQATVVGSTAQTNTATITQSSKPDPNPGNNSGSATVTPQSADLAINKSVDNPTPNVGDTIHYTITLTNNGPDGATGVTAQDTLPAGVTFVSAEPSQGNYDSATGVWTVGSVNVGAPQTLIIAGTVTSSPPPLANTATITHSDQFDPNLANNTVTASINPQHADLSVNKTVSDSRPNVGDTVIFTITLTDNGPANATNVKVTDSLPAGLTLINASPSQGTYTPSTGLWTVGNLEDGAAATLTLQVQVVGPSAKTNTVVISHSDQFDPNPGNNSSSATVIPQQADLAVTKTVDNSTPNVGNVVNFTIAVHNIGPDTATNVLLDDLLPAGLAFVSATPSQGSYDSDNGVWNVGSVSGSETPMLTLAARVVSPGAETNTASIGHSDQFDPNTANNQASTTVTPQQADLKITKSVSDSRPNVGDTIAFTITLNNLGPNIATNVQVTDLLPAGMTFVSAIPSQGTYDSATGLWSVGAVGTLVARTLTLNARVTSPNAKTNTATITGADQFDPNPANNSASVTQTPQKADLSLTKTVNDSHPNVGDVIVYTVTLNNAGPDAATNVKVTDLLPEGLVLVGTAPSQGTYDGFSGLWNVGTIANLGVARLQIEARVNSPDAQFNLAEISQADQFDPDTGNNTAGVLQTPQQADLAIGKSVSNPTPNVGDIITYTLRLSNSGPDPATNVTLQDVLPAGVAFQSSSATAGDFDPFARTWTVGTVPVGAVETLTITAEVTGPNPQTNTASVSHVDQFDPNLANNEDTASVNPQQADLQLDKMVGNPTPNVGDAITYTITLTNNGPNDATNVQVSDLLPTGLSFDSATPSQGNYDPNTGPWTVGTVTTTAPQSLIIQAHVVSHLPQTNTASIAQADQFDPDPGNNTASATQTPQVADLAITKAVNDATPNVGDAVTFTIALTDLGPNAATNVTVQDFLPAGLTLLSFSASRGTYTAATGVWNVGTIDPSAAQTLTLTARVVSPDPQTNTATISHSDQFDPDTTNNSAAATLAPQLADLVVTKTVSDPNPNVGDVITFVVAVSNNGPDPATGVQLTDLLPAGLTLVSVTQSQGTYDSTTGLWFVGQVDTTAAATLTFQARVASPNSQTNTATITHSNQFDPDTGNNSASTTATPQQSDLAVTKSVSDPTPNVGDTITFTVTVSNNGPDQATNVRLRDLLPSGLSFVSATPSQGDYNSTIGVWTVGTVTTTTPQTLLIQATVTSASAQTNTAFISASDQFDPNTGNNNASVTQTPQQSDLALAKTVNNPTPNVGDTITFTITLTNTGPDLATNVQVTDLLPPGLTFVSANTSQGNYDSTNGVWTVGTVTTATPQTLLIQATVAAPTAQTNTARISHSDQFDPNTSNDTTSVTATPQQADLQISKTVSNPTPNVGDTITYTITLTNNGPDAATAVTVQDTLPAGVAFVSATPSQGNYVSASGVWTVGTVNPSASQTLVITARVTSASSLVNSAAISHADQFDPNPNNNSDSSSVDPLQADLSVSKTVSNDAPNVGDTITFTVSVTNTGPHDATNVRLTDLLPAGLTLISSTPSTGTYAPAAGIWTVGTLSNGAKATLTLQARVDSPDARTNTASINHSDQFDPNAGNNSASSTVTPQQSDLVLTKSVNDDRPNVGDTVTFTITVGNQGPDAATNVIIKDLLPAGLGFVSATTSQGSYSSTTGLWTVGTVTTTALQTLTIQARVVSAAARTNTATVNHSDQFDPDSTNNVASATQTPQQADLDVSKTVSDSRPNVGDLITYTVLVTNNGPDTATGVAVNEPIPTGLSFVSAVTATGSYDSASGVWSIGSLGNMSAAVLTITARVVSPSAQTNTASVSHSDQFDPDSTNNSASTTATPQRADLALSKTVSNVRPNVGDIITYTITLTGLGPDAATNVQVSDQLPAGMSFVSASPSQGSYDSTTGIWVVGTVITAIPQVLQIQARVVSPAGQTNTATIDQADQFDPNPGNNTTSVTTSPQQSDLVLAKSVSASTPNVGDIITFTVALTNAGPDPATNVQVTDVLPPGLSFVLATPSQGSYNAITGIWSAGTISTALPQTLMIQARVISPDAQTNTASVTHSDQFDPNPTNNSDSATATPQQADLDLTKTVNDPTPNVGDTITFTITLSNKGPDAATNVQVTDFLPAGFSFVSSTASQGS
jgi:uncharacterized repeat protein (TIGR01451 family)